MFSHSLTERIKNISEESTTSIIDVLEVVDNKIKIAVEELDYESPGMYVPFIPNGLNKVKKYIEDLEYEIKNRKERMEEAIKILES